MSRFKAVMVVPCYNERERIKTSNFLAYAHDFRFLFVDDGSNDGTAEFIESADIPNATVLKLERNSGKAEAVRRGMMAAMDLEDAVDVNWIAFWDADLSTPLEEASDAISYLGRHPEIRSLWCSRVYKLGSDIERTFTRHLLGRIFTTIMSILLNLKSYDSQCGAKLFHRDVCRDIFSEPFLSRWIFDVEIGMRMGGKDIEEYPVRKWSHTAGSKLSFFSDSLVIFTDLFKIRKKYGKL